MGLFSRIDSLLPRWMLTKPRQQFGVLMAGIGGLLDALSEAVYQGRLAAMPGQVRVNGIPQLGGFDSSDALPFLAHDALVYPGLTETIWQLAARIRDSRDDWTNDTSAFGLLDQIAAVLVPQVPIMRLVTISAGESTSWWTRSPDGTRRLQTSEGEGFFLAPDGTSGIDTTMAQFVDWDSATVPPPLDRNDATRAALVIYVPAGTPYLTATDLTFNDPGTYGDAWNDSTAQVVTDVRDGTGHYVPPGIAQPMAGTFGTNSPLEFVSLVRAVIDQRRTMGFAVSWIIVAFDPTSFNPDGSSTPDGAAPLPQAYPDGTWGWHSKYDAPTNERLIARLQTAEYWHGKPGGESP